MQDKIKKKEFKFIDPEVHTRVKIAAAKEGLTISKFIKKMIDRYEGK